MIVLAYCVASDLFAYGLPRGSTPNPGRTLASATSSTCTLDLHGFETGDEILFRPSGDGAMPAGLSAGTTYYAEFATEHTFRVRATAGGAAITFTDADADEPIVVVAPLNRSAAIEYADRLIDDMVPGQTVPFDNATYYPDGVPAIIKMTSAEIAAGKLLAISGSASRSLADTVDAAVKRLERWAKGLPVRGTPDASRANLSVSSPPAAVSVCTDSRGWRRWGGL